MSETTLYRLFDEGGGLLYVGISGRWVRRLASHAAQQGWWDDVASVTRQSFPSRTEALEAEATAIRQERPRYNVRGKPWPDPIDASPRPPEWWMPVVPPAIPGGPDGILWIEGLTTREEALGFAAEQGLAPRGAVRCARPV
jgi:predicted GIY-YIG superfamily endonuclease